MRILILGGSVFLGAAVARHALAAGREVTCFTRGRSGAVPAGATRVRGDRDEPEEFAAVVGPAWDAVVDVSRHPGQVRHAVAALNTQHYLFISSCSVYADTTTPLLTESGPLLRRSGPPDRRWHASRPTATGSCPAAWHRGPGRVRSRRGSPSPQATRTNAPSSRSSGCPDG